jgi:hypothetical protein
MSETDTKLVLQREADTGLDQAGVSIDQMFLEFLIIGATSFGGVGPVSPPKERASRGQWWRFCRPNAEGEIYVSTGTGCTKQVNRAV